MIPSLALLAALNAVAGSLVAAAPPLELEVDLTYGIFRGIANATTGLNVWKGIRYAAPPIGLLRWQPPRQPAANRTVVQANSFGPTCPQGYPSVPNAPFIPGNEDCLFLNVYAPANASNLPVMVWIHGGGYGLGDGTQDMSTFINANNKRFIAVVIQYRLGAFGFLSSQDVVNRGVANAGLLDQAFALKWVQSYIKLFGGDASKVTIAGESAGGGSVLQLAVAQLGNTSFSNGIASSPYLPPQYPYNNSIYTARYNDFVAKAGCANVTSKMDCLVEKDSMTLQMANANVSSSQTYGTWAFLPVTDGKFIQTPPSIVLQSKNINGKRLLVSNNANEGILFTPQTIETHTDLHIWLHESFPKLEDEDVDAILDIYGSGQEQANNNASPKFATDGFGPATANNVSQAALGEQQRANNIIAESFFVCPSYWMASAFSGNNRTSYKYQYSVPFASHGDDLSAVFGPPTPNQGPDFVKALSTIWGNFITRNDPSIPSTIANGDHSNSTASNPASFWPIWSDNSTLQLNLNETGGTPYTASATFSGSWNVTQFRDPGLTNNFKRVDADKWEGGRGARCRLWAGLFDKMGKAM